MKLTPREPTPEMVEAERVKFSAWVVTQGWVEAPVARENGSYVNGQLQARWLAWIARASLDDGKQAEPKKGRYKFESETDRADYWKQRALSAEAKDSHAHVVKLEAELSRLVQAGVRSTPLVGAQWWPIGIAPKDGTAVLVFDPSTEEPRIWIAEFCVFEGDPDPPQWLTLDSFTAVDPTHWMPLPAPPSDKGE